MAVTQSGTGGLTCAGLATIAAEYITVPSGSIIESITPEDGGSPIYDDQFDEDGAFHTRLTYEKGMNKCTVVMVGKDYTKQAGDVDGASSNYYVESCPAENTKGPVRTTITVTRLPTIA
jgi:K+-transporting ATPase c subunit